MAIFANDFEERTIQKFRQGSSSAIWSESPWMQSSLRSERRLMLTILEDAISVFRKHVAAQGVRGKALFHEAEDWIMEKNSDWVFSFESICEVLHIDPHGLREEFMGWKARERARRLHPKERGNYLRQGFYVGSHTQL